MSTLNTFIPPFNSANYAIMENGWDGLRGSKKATKIVNDLITADENEKRGFRIYYKFRNN